MSLMQQLASVARKKAGNASFPAVESVTESSFSSSSTSHAATYPATVNSGDLLIIVCTFHSFSGSAFTITDPSGYTELYDVAFTGSGDISHAAVFVKSASGSEGGGSETLTTSLSVFGAAQVYRITGWSGTIGDVESGTTATGSSSAPNPGSLTLSAGSGNNLWVATAHSADDDAATSSYPTGYSNGVDTACGGGANNSGRIATARRTAVAATEDPDAFALASTEVWVAAVVGIPPA